MYKAKKTNKTATCKTYELMRQLAIINQSINSNIVLKAHYFSKRCVFKDLGLVIQSSLSAMLNVV